MSDDPKTTLPEGRITDEALDKLRQMVGIQLRSERFVRMATPDTMRHFVNGIGDLNPLFRDHEYAQWTRWGGILAHPCFPYARHYPGRTRFGLPGVHGFLGGNDWRWFRVVKPGDTLSCTEQVTGVEEKQSRFSGRLVLTTTMTTYYNQRDEVIAEVEGWSTRHERRASRERTQADKAERARAAEKRRRATEAQLEAIHECALTEAERIIGPSTIYWEDVKEGDEIPTIVRGPLTHMDITAYLIGVGRSRGAHGVLLQEARRHPGHFFRNVKASGGVEYTGMGHMTSDVAGQVGAPGAYDYGPQRISWLASLLTNWVGDLGALTRLRAELRGFNIVGDATWLKGRVTGTRRQNGEALVDLRVWGENQLGETTMPGTATVRLPSRAVPRA